MRLISSILFLISTTASTLCAEISGIPTITDGDTVVIAGQKIRLLDMDAPETDQFCLDNEGAAWTCGIAAREALRRYAGGREWTCESNSRDRYDRLLAFCVLDGESISRWMVREGWAMSPITRGYSHRYDSDELAARNEKVGLWSGAFIALWEWRARNCKTIVLGAVSVPIDAVQKLCGSPDIPPNPSCTIKATQRKGKCTYHLDSGHYYGKIRITGNYKRWFCSEAEAEAAGCKRASR